MAILFKSTKMLVAQIDDFLDAISQGALVFKRGLIHYLESDSGAFEKDIESIRELENNADDLRREIENQLYTHSLIPENRGDVLGLLESMDNVIDTAKATLVNFAIETPDIPMELIKKYIELADTAVQASESTVLAARAFFRDVQSVKNHLHKIYFFEKEADKTGEHLKRSVFGLGIDLSRKLHLTDFIKQIDNIADRAEEVADRLTIYSIKRSV